MEPAVGDQKSDRKDTRHTVGALTPFFYLFKRGSQKPAFEKQNPFKERF